MHRRPYVFVNVAVTADGKVDTVARSGARISGPADVVRVDELRAGADAILVGGRTLMGEDPRLTVRDPDLVAARIARGAPPQPAKIAVCSAIGPLGAENGLPADSRFLGEGSGAVHLFTTTASDPAAIDALEQAGVHVEVHPEARVDLPRALASLADRGIGRLMVEGGGTIIAALLDDGLVDELQLAIAPRIFGGEGAPTPVGGAGRSADAAVGLELADVGRSADGDIVARYLVVGA